MYQQIQLPSPSDSKTPEKSPQRKRTKKVLLAVVDDVDDEYDALDQVTTSDVAKAGSGADRSKNQQGDDRSKNQQNDDDEVGAKQDSAQDDSA